MVKNKNKERNEKKILLKNVVSKRRTFKFNIKKILKERQEQDEFLNRNAELNKEMIVIDDLYQNQINLNQSLGLTNNNVVKDEKSRKMDTSNYNIPFTEDPDSDITKSCLRRFHIMSVEGNELEAVIHFNNLLKANWSPVLDDVKNILCNWGVDLDAFTTESLLKPQIHDSKNIGRHNFELVMNFLSHSILNNNNGFSNNDLLILAKFTATIYLDHHCGQMLHVIKQLFSTCIVKAIHDDNDIIKFAQELYSHCEEDCLCNMAVDLFLPLEDHGTMKKMYSFITFKLFNSLLEKTTEKLFPSHLNDWFVQDLVDKNYFKQKPRSVLNKVIRLLEHIVIVFDLYKDEDKLSNMYYFLSSIPKPSGLTDSLKLDNILDQWRLKLFRIHVDRKSALV